MTSALPTIAMGMLHFLKAWEQVVEEVESTPLIFFAKYLAAAVAVPAAYSATSLGGGGGGGRGSKRRGSDLRYDLQITLEEAAFRYREGT